MPTAPLDRPCRLHTSPLAPAEAYGEPFEQLAWLAEVRSREERLRAELAEVRAREARLRTELAEARARERTRGQFVNSLNHELRTPLTSILGYVELLEDGDAGALNAEQAAYVQEVHAGASRLRRLVDDLLDLAAIESGNFSLHLAEADLTAIARQAVASLRPFAVQRGVLLEAMLPVRPLSAYCDADRLEQVLLNLLSNALKFTAAGGTVRVRLLGEGRTALLDVVDSGTGIAPADLSKLFRRFGRLGGSSAPGTGLGLAICKGLVEAHGGTIGVESELGFGSRFFCRWPLGGPVEGRG